MFNNRFISFQGIDFTEGGNQILIHFRLCLSLQLIPVNKGWKALKSYVHEDGMLGYVQPVSAAPEQVTQNMTEVYGVGAFLMAGIEMLKMK